MELVSANWLLAQQPPLTTRTFTETLADPHDSNMVLSPMYPNILCGIGETPLVRLRSLEQDEGCVLLAKAEHLNAGGSVKSRTALGMVRDAHETGQLKPGDTIIEVSSGNEGVALAMIGVIYGNAISIVMPSDVPPERRALIERYGGSVTLVDARENVAETLHACFQVAEALASRRDCYYARQFENPSNPRVHESTTGAELIRQSDWEIAAFVAGIGTGGTLTGVGRALRRRYPKVQIVAVEPAHAAVLSGRQITTHRQYGIGEGFVPALLDQAILDDVVIVTDEEAYETARILARDEGLMVGPTSGSNVFAARKIARNLGAGVAVATLLPDSAERYLSLL